MKIRLANATIFDPRSKFHLKKLTISIADGFITKIGDSKEGKLIDLKGKIVTPGWVDLFANFNEPGFENKEDILSGIQCAINGGYTDVCIIPNTEPPIETKGDVKYILNQSNEVDLLPLAALSEGLKGDNLTEILDLHSNGAVAFTDGLNPIWNTELLLKSLQYLQKFDGLIIQRAKDLGLGSHAQMHEGVISTSLGLNGEPSLSEELIVQRDIEILKYAGGRIHFSQVSTKKSVELIKRAKKEGWNITCDVSINHLCYTESNLEGFDTNYKVDPPLRTEKDRKALIKGLVDGTIDAISSSHQPQDTESKDLEFDLADFGAISLQTIFPQLLSIQNELPMDVFIDKLTHGPRTVLRLEKISIEEGSESKLAVFDIDHSWVFDNKSNNSKSRNSPLFGQQLIGRSCGVINGGIISLTRI